MPIFSKLGGTDNNFIFIMKRNSVIVWYKKTFLETASARFPDTEEFNHKNEQKHQTIFIEKSKYT